MIKVIDISEYENFNSKNQFYNFFQSTKLAQAREFLYDEVLLLGCRKDGSLVATTLLLLEQLPRVKYKIGNVIMGINIDYSVDELVKFYSDAMRKFMKSRDIVYIRYDFDVYKKQLNQDYSLAKFEIGLQSYPNFGEVLNKAEFKKVDFSYDYFGKSPQWSMVTDTSSYEILSTQLNRSVKRGIKDAKKFGCEAFLVEDVTKFDDVYQKSYLDIFYDLHCVTAENSSFNPFSKAYFEQMTSNCGENVCIYLVKVDTQILKQELEVQYNKKQTDRIKVVLDQLSNESKPYLYVVGHMSALMGKTGYDLFTGLDYSFGFLGAKELVYECIFDTCISRGVMYYDYWGIVGKPDEDHVMYPIYKFKSKFSKVIVEKHGFYDLYSNKLLYNSLLLGLKLRKRLR